MFCHDFQTVTTGSFKLIDIFCSAVFESWRCGNFAARKSKAIVVVELNE